MLTKEQTLNRFRRACSRREYCSGDIAKKVASLDTEPGFTAQDIISVLLSEKFLDDSRYAEAFVRDKSSLQGWGASKIRYALRAKGLDEETIAQAMCGIDQERAQAKLQAVLAAKYRTLKGEEEEKFQKLLRFAVGRGYSFLQVKETYNQIKFCNDSH
ncbi:MAG: RecX family transcriptional regulator [Bacteroidales bacterium]|nr:RecX family transcriptional regulator [Bacteroidales bacterium]